MSNTIEKPITIEDIRKVRDELKSFTSKWALRLAVKMFPTLPPPVARERLYNIISGANRASDSVYEFITHAKALKEELMSEAAAARKHLNDIMK